MTEKKKLLIRALMGGVVAMGLLLLFWIWFHLTGFSPQGRVPVGDFNIVSNATVAMFGSYWLAAAVEFTCMFALGAAIGAATMPFADDTRSLLQESFIHFVVTGALVLLNGWVQGLFPSGGLAFFLVPYTLLYLLIWFGRWIGWYVEVAQIKVKLGLIPAHSPLKWRETLPYLPFLLVLCVLLPMVLMWVDRIVISAPVLSGLLMPYILFPIVGLCSGISLGKRQGFCILYPVAAYLLYVPIVFWLFNYTALFHADVLFTAALIGNIIGTVYRKRKQNKEVAQ